MFDFKMLDEWAREQQPVFIVGPERSGTSMIFRSIVSHPSFCSFDNATVETFCFLRPHALVGKQSPSNYEMRVYLGEQYDEFQNAIAPIRKINAICDHTNVPQNYLIDTRKMVWHRRHYRELLRAFFYFSWLNLGQKRLAEKTPAHIRTVEEIFDCFPNARLLVCVRNSLEIIASHRKRYERELELGKSETDPGLKWLQKSAVEYIEYFKHTNNLIEKACRNHPAKVMLVPYSKVTTSPDFFASVYRFLGEDPVLLNPNKELLVDKSLDWDPLLASMPTENKIDVEKWMNVNEIKTVQNVAGTLKEKGWE